jgi:hypothetical protein
MMQGLSPVWGSTPGPLFEEGLSYDAHQKGTQQSDNLLDGGRQVLSLESAQVQEALEDRIVGIVSKKDLSDLTKCTPLNDEYIVNGLLKDLHRNLGGSR